jgi:hypothetical protein
VSPDDAASDGQHGSQAAALAHADGARGRSAEEQRRFIETHDEAHHLEPLFTEATGAATALEETAFLLPLIPPTVDLSLLTLLETLAIMLPRRLAHTSAASKKGGCCRACRIGWTSTIS